MLWGQSFLAGSVLSVALWGPEWLLCAAVGKPYLGAHGTAIKETLLGAAGYYSVSRSNSSLQRKKISLLKNRQKTQEYLSGFVWVRISNESSWNFLCVFSVHFISPSLIDVFE